MNANEYQKLAARTLIDGPDFEVSNEEFMLMWNVIGLTDEAGEVAGLIKKGVLHRHGLDVELVKKEIGDVLWYAAGICTTLGIDLADVMEANVEKLRKRYPHGFSSADSIARVDVRPEGS